MFKKKIKKPLMWKVIAGKYVDGRISTSEQQIENEKFNVIDVFNAAKEVDIMTVVLIGGSYQGFWIRLFDGNFYPVPLPY